MFGFLKKIKNTSSRAKANERLRVVLSHDRIGSSTQLMQVLQEEIIQVIVKHVEVDGSPEINIVSKGRHSVLDINIPLKGR